MKTPRQVEESGVHRGLPNLFGNFQDSYQLWEAPVTTVPVVRLPMHSTFVLTAGRPLFDLGLALVQARGVPMI